MSVQRELWDSGVGGLQTQTPAEAKRASLWREIRYLLTISSNPALSRGLSQSGVAHSLGVCLIEDWNMARGKGGAKAGGGDFTLPRFIDIKLDQASREAFVVWLSEGHDPVVILRAFADTGYRVGISWSGEHQSYTVSVTCRSSDQPNDGLCMTSFAGDLLKAVCLAWFKHSVLAKGAWQTYAPEETQGFG